MVHNKLYIYKCNDCNIEFEYAVTTTNRGMISSYNDKPKPPQCPDCKSLNCVKVIQPVEFGFSKGLKRLEMKGDYDHR